MLFVCLGIYYGIYLQYVLLEKIVKKVMVSHILRYVELTKIPGNHETLSIVHHVGLHVDFSSMKSSLGI